MNWNVSLKELEAEAIRDRINEASRTSRKAQAMAKSAAAADLPDMRAER